MQRRATPNDYSLLQLEPGAPLTEIKRAYRERAKRLHPDTSRDPAAAQRFQELRTSYEAILASPLQAYVPLERLLFGTTGVPHPAALRGGIISDMPYERACWCSCDAVTVDAQGNVFIDPDEKWSTGYAAGMPLIIAHGHAGFIISFALAEVVSASWPATAAPTGVEAYGVFAHDGYSAHVTTALDEIARACHSSRPLPTSLPAPLLRTVVGLLDNGDQGWCAPTACAVDPAGALWLHPDAIYVPSKSYGTPIRVGREGGWYVERPLPFDHIPQAPRRRDDLPASIR